MDSRLNFHRINPGSEKNLTQRHSIGKSKAFYQNIYLATSIYNFDVQKKMTNSVIIQIKNRTPH